jgi:hypothetical protein
LENQSAKITVSSYNVVSFFFLPESVTFTSRFIFGGFPDQTTSYQGTTENESANEGYRFGHEEETYTSVARNHRLLLHLFRIDPA